jgi:hypothetical protein
MMRPADKGLIIRAGGYGLNTGSGGLTFFGEPGFLAV